MDLEVVERIRHGQLDGGDHAVAQHRVLPEIGDLPGDDLRSQTRDVLDLQIVQPSTEIGVQLAEEAGAGMVLPPDP